MADHRRSPRCKALLAQLSDYIDDELEEALCSEIESHLQSCQDCQILVDTTRKTIALYQRHHLQTSAHLSPNVTGRLWEALTKAGFPSGREDDLTD